MSTCLVEVVDTNGRVIRIDEKLKVHQEGSLHSAFSIFVFNAKSELLIQRRNKDKYHCGDKWSNTCCSHPFPGESVLEAGKRRLSEEMGLQCDLRDVFNTIYRVNCDNGLVEHEYNTVLIGHSNDTPQINPQEVVEFKWVDVFLLCQDIVSAPEEYTPWFRVLLLDAAAAFTRVRNSRRVSSAIN